MYEVTIENLDRNFILIHSQRTDNRITGSFTKAKNQVPSFTFTIYPDNVGFNKIIHRKSQVRITDTRTGKQVFGGRVLLIQPCMDSSGIMYKQVTCEGWLGLLNDSINYLYDGNMDGSYINKVVEELLRYHNLQSSEENQIRLLDFTTNIALENYQPSYDRNTLDALMDEQLTDYLSYEVTETLDHQKISHKYLECHASGAIGSETAIEVGLNMQSLSVTNNFDELCTICLPLTKDGIPMGTIGKDEVTVEDATAISNYGRIVKSHTFESIKKPEKLKNAAKNWLKKNSVITHTISVSALDLNCIGITPEEFDLYKTYSIICDELGINEALELTQITRDLNDPWNVQLVFGDRLYSARKKI